MNEALKEFNAKIDELDLPGMKSTIIKDYAKALVKGADDKEDEQQEKKQSVKQKDDKSIVELARSKRKI